MQQVQFQAGKNMQKIHAEEKLHKNGATLQTPSRKLLNLYSKWVSAQSAPIAIKLLHLYPYKTTVFHKPYGMNYEARVNFSNWYLCGMHDKEIDPTLVLFSKYVWFHHNRYWCAENSMFIHKVPFHDVKVGVWCAECN